MRTGKHYRLTGPCGAYNIKGGASFRESLSRFRCYTQKHDLEKMAEMQPEVKLRYFRDKMSIGQGPQLAAEVR